MGNQYTDFTKGISHTAIAPASSGVNSLVAAPGANKRLCIVGYRLSASAAVEAQFYSGTTATTLSGTFYMDALDVIGEPTGPYPVFDLPANKAFGVDLNGATVCGGYVKYRTISQVNS